MIATVDTGANVIPDLQDAFVPGWDFIENDGDPQDTHGHGTRVASVIAARGNNQIGMAGHCWGCRVMPIRVSANGSATPARIATGIVYAVDHGARIVNVSLSHPGNPDAAEAAAVQYAIDRGVLVVASAGNTGTEARQYPGAYPGVLAVGASDDIVQMYMKAHEGMIKQYTEAKSTLPKAIAEANAFIAKANAMSNTLKAQNITLTVPAAIK